MQNKNKLDLSDEELMSLYQMSDYSAYEILYKRHSGKIYKYLQRKVGSETAQELLQEIFARLHTARDKYDSQYPFLPWIFTVTRNTLFDYFRKAETQVAQNSSSVEFPILSNELSLSELGSMNELGDVLSLLPDHQRRAIELRYLRDWSFERIAREIETSPQNVRQLISRGLKRIRAAVDKKGVH
jgi:RNA polymerase sigma-70 factor (ECF subfamily)